MNEILNGSILLVKYFAVSKVLWIKHFHTLAQAACMSLSTEGLKFSMKSHFIHNIIIQLTEQIKYS